MLSHGSKRPANLSSHLPSDLPLRQAVMETLEARQLLSVAGHETLFGADLRSMTPAEHMHPLAKESTTPAQRIAQQQANKLARQAAAAVRKAAMVQKEIAQFQNKITAEVRHHPKKINDPKFQAHIANEQAVFARKIAKQGGTYTPIPFANLVVGTAPSVAAPTITGTAISASEIDLSWTAVANAVSYKLESSSDGGTTWAVLASTATPSYANVGLTADTAYKYRVTAYTAGAASAASTLATVTTLVGAPTGFTAAATSATNVNLAWTVVTDATSYKIERSLNGSSWTALTPGSPFTGSSNSLSDATVSAGTTYYYRISSVVSAGSSSPSAVVTASTYPAMPTLTTAVISTSEIDLSWTAIPSAFSYKLETSTDGGNTWSTLATPTATTYAHTGLTADTSHKYRLTAVNSVGNSVVSPVVTASTLLSSVTGLTATVISATEIDLGWVAVVDAVTYKVERSIDNTAWTTLSSNVAGSATTYADTTAQAGTTYYYRISAVDAAGASLAEATGASLTLPVAPTLSANVISATEVDLTWTASQGAATYKLERSIDGGISWTTAASPSTTSFNNTGLTADTAYKYRVSAVNATGSSVVSASVPVITLLAAQLVSR